MRQARHQNSTPLQYTYAARQFDASVPKDQIPDEGMPANAAYQIIHDEMNLDGNPAMNLASFVTTWMEPEAEKLFQESLNKNFVDQDEYPQTEEIHQRVISMLARLFNAPSNCSPIGTATIGSSEAIMLALLAHKWSWRKRREAEGKPTDRPNLVFGADVHSCWEKFGRYFDVEMRVQPMRKDCFILTADQVESAIDENTIAVGCVVGTTYTGQIDQFREINDLLQRVKAEKGWDIPIHVDGASGGFVAPFVYPEVEWDFRLERVRSINVSNHKFGLVYPGMGSVIFKDKSDLPEELPFHITYLGGEMINYSLNFSRASSQVLMQYYNFIRLGMDGYRRIMTTIMDNAHFLEKKLLEIGCFELLNDSKYLPVVTVRLKPDTDFTVYQLSDALRQFGWIVPAYPLAPNADEVHVLRMVVKENFSRDMAEACARDVGRAIEGLRKLKSELSSLEHLRDTDNRIC